MLSLPAAAFLAASPVVFLVAGDAAAAPPSAEPPLAASSCGGPSPCVVEPASLKALSTRLAQPPPCVADPAYAAWRRDCLEPSGGLERAECAWVPVLDELLAGRRGEAEQALGAAFELPPEKRSTLMSLASLFAPLLLESGACTVGQAPDLMQLLVDLMGRKDLFGVEGFQVLGRLTQVDPRALERAPRSRGPGWQELGHAAQALADAFENSVGLGRVQRTLARMPLSGRRPGLFPTTHVWEDSLHDLAPHLEAIDRALENTVADTGPGDRFARLGAAVGSLPSDRAKALGWTRAGVGLGVLGRHIEAWTALSWAEDRYRRLGDLELDRDPLLRLGRYLGRIQRLLAALQLEMAAEIPRLMLEVQSGTSELEQRLLEGFMVTQGSPSATPERSLKTAFEHFREKPLRPEEDELFWRAYQVVVPGLAGSPAAVRATEEAVEARDLPPREQPIEMTAILEAWLVHGREAGLEEWWVFARLMPHWGKAIWPAQMMKEAFFDDGDPVEARLALDAMLEFFERDLDPLWADELVRSALDQHVFRFYPSAVDVAARSFAPETETFHYSERARSYTLRRLLGLPPDGASLPSARERELEEEIVRLERRGTPSERLGEARGHFASARLERKLLDVDTEIPPFPAPVEVEALRREVLLEGEALLAYFPGKDGLHIWVVRRDGLWRREIASPLSDLAELGRRVEGARGRSRGGEPLVETSQDEDSSRWLYDRLVAPVAAWLEGERSEVKRLIVLPFGALHRVPWAALRDPQGRRLIEDFEMAVAPSADTFAALRSRRPVSDPSPPRAALVLGDPDSPLPPLDGARREARVVADFFGVRPLLGAAATEAALLEGARNARVLHVAAHGVYERHHPLWSRLLLSEGDGQDGFLHTHEIWDRLQLCQARLVVLSACDTAAGEPSAADDVLGLTQAFLVAGAPAVIATLWPVDDPTSARLMTAFYSRFKAGATAAAALRGAQRELLREDPSLTPYLWAGYVLVGDPEASWRIGDSR